MTEKMTEERQAIVLRGQTHEFEIVNKELVLLPELLVVLVHEEIKRPVRHYATKFLLSAWKDKSLPEPEDLVGQLVPVPVTLDSLATFWKEKGALPQRPVLAVDFDGVIAEYHGWKGDKSFGEPIRDPVTGWTAKEAFEALRKRGYWICVWTTRAPVGVWHYCTTRGIPVDSINSVLFRNWTKKKVCAEVYLDDRGMCFKGQWTPDLVHEILNFRPHWESPGEPESFIPVTDTGMKEALDEELSEQSSG